MIGVFFKIIFTVTIHLAFFSFYPDGGKYADVYLWISLVLWSCFWIVFSGKFPLSKKLIFPLNFVINTAIMIIIAFFISITMPQEDGRTVLSKVLNGDFPDEDQISRGKIKYLNNFSFKTGGLKEGAILREGKKIIEKARAED